MSDWFTDSSKGEAIMPITGWNEVVGKLCCECGGPATHIYGDVYWCCDCHAGKDNGLYTREQAQAEHDKRVFTNCNVCGIKLRTADEDKMGMCVRCAGE
jgi:hypothetical protein